MRLVKRFGDVAEGRPFVRPRVFFAPILLLLALPASSASEAAGTTGEVLLGRTGAAEVLAISPEWRRGYDEYQPAPEDVAVVRQAPAGSLVMVYFGSWCSDSRLGVPQFLKIVDAAQAPNLKVRYLAVDRSKKEPAGPLEGVGLELVPTFVLSVHGKEIGRIVETPATTIEHDLALLLRKATSSPAS
ncbi:MAG TPA: thioredoxin family protein [Candidatus Polarisedimenticolia bacterium]|nr:thioredoxin family protein [Candidatus Polarisedimenticolia bacterium]